MPPKQKARQVNSNNTESSNRNCKIPADEWRVIILMIDIYTLCRLRATCNELYNLADEQKLWAERCLSRFPHPDLYSVLPAFDADWRRMFFAKRRLRLDGIYISRCSVVRYVRATGNIHLQGEKGPITHDGAAKTIVIHYGRYLKFVDAKRVIVARSTQTESEVVSVIKMIDEANRKRNTAQQINGMTRGRFGFQNNSYYDIVASSNQQNHRGSLLDIPPRGACTTTGTSGPNDTDLMPKIADLGVGSAEISCVQFVRLGKYELTGNSGEPIVRISYMSDESSSNELTLVLSDRKLDHGTMHNSKLSWLNFQMNEPTWSHVLPLDKRHFKPFLFCRIKSLNWAM